MKMALLVIEICPSNCILLGNSQGQSIENRVVFSNIMLSLPWYCLSQVPAMFAFSLFLETVD